MHCGVGKKGPPVSRRSQVTEVLYDEMIARYRPKKLPDRIYNAGDSARLLAAHLGVDAIAFSKLSITITPAGKAIVSALIGGTTSGANSMIGIVDGDTADLEVVQIAIAIVAPGEKTPDEIAGYVATLAAGNTKRLPGADPSQRIEIEPVGARVIERA